MTPVKLKKPIKFGDKDVTKIDVRRPSAGEMRGLTLVDVNTLDVDTLIKLLPRITQPPITEAQVADLSFDDITAFGMALVTPNAEDKASAGNGTTLKP